MIRGLERAFNRLIAEKNGGYGEEIIKKEENEEKNREDLDEMIGGTAITINKFDPNIVNNSDDVLLNIFYNNKYCLEVTTTPNILYIFTKNNNNMITEYRVNSNDDNKDNILIKILKYIFIENNNKINKNTNIIKDNFIEKLIFSRKHDTKKNINDEYDFLINNNINIIENLKQKLKFENITFNKNLNLYDEFLNEFIESLPGYQFAILSYGEKQINNINKGIPNISNSNSDIVSFKKIVLNKFKKNEKLLEFASHFYPYIVGKFTKEANMINYMVDIQFNGIYKNNINQLSNGISPSDNVIPVTVNVNNFYV